MTKDLGSLSAQGDLRSVRFARFIDATPEELWDALTNPERIARWMLTEETTLEPRVGGKAHFGWGDQGDAVGRVTIFDPPRCLEYTWEEDAGTSAVRFDVRQLEGRLELVLHHRNLAPKVSGGVGAGWHAHLDDLMALLRGEEFDFWSRLHELEPVYEEIATKL